MFAVQRLGSRTLSCSRQGQEMDDWAVSRAVEFKRNLAMQAEMKRDSSGSMGHWGASGTRYFGAGVGGHVGLLRDGLGVTTHQ